MKRNLWRDKCIYKAQFIVLILVPKNEEHFWIIYFVILWLLWPHHKVLCSLHYLSRAKAGQFLTYHNNYHCLLNGVHIYLSSRSISINSNMSMHLSSSGMWSANMDTGSSQSILQPRISDSFKACTCKDWLGTRAHWLGFKHCTLSLGGNCRRKGKELQIYWMLYFSEHVVIDWCTPCIFSCMSQWRLCNTWKINLHTLALLMWVMVIHSIPGYMQTVLWCLSQNIEN
jgi:hypothetical protein